MPLDVLTVSSRSVSVYVFTVFIPVCVLYTPLEHHTVGMRAQNYELPANNNGCSMLVIDNKTE